MTQIWKTPCGDSWSLYEDMLRQPHLLIAGATGSGKSVVINALIHTALLRNAPGYSIPNSCEFILIDPKRVELVQYRNLPHTICYASEQEQMVSALQYAISLCDFRYQQMQAQGLRKYPGGDVYVIIDEFADLMTTQKRVVMPLIQRLAQIGRAAKIHIILATQTPIAKVLPTEIKCNFDSRVGLRTRSQQDSRNIIGYRGLEELPRYGRAYYMTPEQEGFMNVPMYSDYEISQRVQWWVQQKQTKTQTSHTGWFRNIFKKVR